MANIVDVIFSQKISEIQARVPVKLRLGKQPNRFDEALSAALQKTLDSSHAIGTFDKSYLSDDLRGIIEGASQKYGVDSSLIWAVIKAESGFNPLAKSPAGALGLMQLMPGTAGGLGVSDPLDPVQNVYGGTRYLRMLLDRYGGDVKMALAAYNCGSATLQRRGITNLDSEEQISKLYSETRNYVKKVIEYMSMVGR